MLKSAKLIDDASWKTAHEQQSAFPYKYHTAFAPTEFETAPFVKKCAPFAGGCKQFNVTASAVDAYNSKILAGTPGFTRTHRSASTQLIGGPFKARGDGPLMYPNTLSELLTPAEAYRPRCVKRLSEVNYETWQCINAPLAVEVGVRGGVSTRQGLQYITQC
jgi:hypothetical protein